MKGPRGADVRPSEREDGKPHSLPHCALVDEQVAEVNALEHVVDLLLQHDPHRANAATLGLGTPLRAHRVRHAVEVERAELGRRDDLANGDLDRWARQRVTAAGAAGAVDQTGAPQAQQDLLDVIRREPLSGRDLASSDRPLARPLREVEGADQSVFGPRCDAHAGNLPAALPECQPSAAGTDVVGTPRDADLGHLAQVEHLVDLCVGEHVLSLDEIAN
jgi:hypothetical protein